MADTRVMLSQWGNRHKAIPIPGGGWQTACPQHYRLYEADQHRCAASACSRCFPSSDDSLGAASTTLNPPPGEHTGDQNA